MAKKIEVIGYIGKSVDLNQNVAERNMKNGATSIHVHSKGNKSKWGDEWPPKKIRVTVEFLDE